MSDQLTVAELSALLPKPTDEYVQTVLADVAVTDNGEHIALEATGEEYPLDDTAERSLARFLSVPFTYLDKCPGSLKAANLNYWLRKNFESDVMVRISAEHEIEEFYAPDRIVLPPHGVAEVIAHLFRPSDRIVSFHNDGETLVLDVVDESEQVAVEPNGILDRTHDDLPEIGDVSWAGLRIVLPSNVKKTPPTVETALYRLSSGTLTVPETVCKMRLKGQTVDDVLEQMESVGKDQLAELPRYLEGYRHSAEVRVPGNPLTLIRQIGHEQRLPRPVINKALDYASGYGDKPWTAYDVAALLARLASGAVWSTAVKLQAIAGELATDAEDYMRRCSTCERPLADYQRQHDHTH